MNGGMPWIALSDSKYRIKIQLRLRILNLVRQALEQSPSETRAAALFRREKQLYQIYGDDGRSAGGHTTSLQECWS